MNYTLAQREVAQSCQLSTADAELPCITPCPIDTYIYVHVCRCMYVEVEQSCQLSTADAERRLGWTLIRWLVGPGGTAPKRLEKATGFCHQYQ